MSEKPMCTFGEDENVFAIIGAVRRALKRAHMENKATEFSDRVKAECKSYDDVLTLVQEYVEIE